MKNKQFNKRTLKEEEVQGTSVESKKWSKKDRKKGFKYKGVKANDPAWHGKNSQIVKDLCSYPFNHMQGFPVRLGHKETKGKYYIPSLQVFGFDWFAGVSKDFKSMLNTAATNIWEFVRGRNSGATNYQASDIFTNIVIGALDIVSSVQAFTRAFGCTRIFSVYNRLSPRQFIESMGIDYDDFNSNIAAYRGRFNLLIAKASALVLPKQFPLYDWVGSMFSNIYKDADTETGREQLYMFTKKVFHIFDSKGSPNGGRVRIMTWKDVQGSGFTTDKQIFLDAKRPMKFSLLLDVLESQINAIVTDEDCNIIMGDLIKAYGSEAKFWSLRPVTEDELSGPVYSEEVLDQIHNAVLLPSLNQLAAVSAGRTYLPDNTFTNSVEQDENHYLVSNFVLDYGTLNYDVDWDLYPTSDEVDNYLLIDSGSVQPSPDAVLNLTRMQNRYYTEYNEVSLRRYVKMATGSALILFADYMVEGSDTGMKLTLISPTPSTGFTFETIAKIFAFKKYPLLYAGYSRLPSDPVTTVPVGEVNNVTTIANQSLQRMHEVDFASLLDIPFSNKF